VQIPPQLVVSKEDEIVQVIDAALDELKRRRRRRESKMGYLAHVFRLLRRLSLTEFRDQLMEDALMVKYGVFTAASIEELEGQTGETASDGKAICKEKYESCDQIVGYKRTFLYNCFLAGLEEGKKLHAIHLRILLEDLLWDVQSWLKKMEDVVAAMRTNSVSQQDLKRCFDCSTICIEVIIMDIRILVEASYSCLSSTDSQDITDLDHESPRKGNLENELASGTILPVRDWGMHHMVDLTTKSN
jgi:hypothetical protein